MISSQTSPPTAPRTARVWTLQAAGTSVDVEVTARDHDLLRDVLPELAAVLGREVAGLWAASSRLADDLPLTAPSLAHGAVLGLGGPVPGDRRGRPSALELRVTSGPDAGRAVPLGQGRHVIGRGTEAAVRLDDPDVSRRHVAVEVVRGSITVADLGSTNGSLLGDRALDGHPRTWPTGTALRVGASAVTVVGPDGATAALEPAAGGRWRVRPMSRPATPLAESEVVFPRPPADPPRRRLAVVAVALPAVGGLLMAWLLHTPTFLFFALLSPLVALGTWISERWNGRRSGRRDRAAHALEVLTAENELAEAAAADVRTSEAASPDLATLVAAAARRTHLLWSRGRGDADALTVRVGTGPGLTRVTRVRGDGSRERVPAAHLPVTVDLRAGGGLAVVGPRERALGVLAAVLAQLTTLHAPGDVDLLLLTDAARLGDWRWARRLPHLPSGMVHVRPTSAEGRTDDELNAWMTGLASRRRETLTRHPRGQEAAAAWGWLVVVADRALEARLAGTLRDARDCGVLVLTTAGSAEELNVPVPTVLRLAGETGDVGVLSRAGLPDRPEVHVDRLPRTTAADLARDLACLAPAATTNDLPRLVRLLELPTPGLSLDASDHLTGSWSDDRDRLIATIGCTADGPIQVDLCREGPHALVAGTTGSGKSELLQTLIAGLALAHPPDRCSFFLVDYKGGAAFAEAATLPHTVGLVTDLDAQTTTRALRSLGAELTRREQVLAAHDAVDIAALPDDVPLARLVIVVDEFATLAEELPEFVPGLIAIAQRGRSLGVHLVLATQRPSGVVSPEIRANCTLRICLRTTDEADSRDVLGSSDAAHLPVDLPGRAFLRTGSGAPVAVQVARVAGAPDREPGGAPVVRPYFWPAGPLQGSEASGPPDASDLARLCRALTPYVAAIGSPLPHRPWRPSLPTCIPAAELSDHLDGDAVVDAAPTRLPIGLIDRPDRQTRELLEIDIDEGGTWLAVGGPRSGRTTLLRAVLGEAVHRAGPDDLHVHVIESGGGSLTTRAAALPHAGTSVRTEDVFRTVRLVDRLAQEVAARRAGTVPGPHPRMLVLIDGIEALTAQLDDADPARGSAALLRLLRDGAAVGLTCVVTADRAVPGGRLAAVARQRIVLPLPDRADYAVAGIPARAVPETRPPGRGLVGEAALECQLVLPRSAAVPVDSGPPFPPPIRIADLPADAVLPLPCPDEVAASADGVLSLPIGPGGDEGEPLVLDLLRTGGLLVSGSPGCGRSTALAAFAEHLHAVGAQVVRLGVPKDTSPGRPDGAWLDPGDEAGLRDWVAALDGRPGVVVADDVGTPPEWAALGALPTVRARSGVVLLAAGPPGQLTGHYQGPIAALRRARAGLLLCPGPGDADLLGVRLPRLPLPVRPGSGWLVAGAVMDRVQVARRVPGAAPGSRAAPQSSSSAGPISCVAYQASS